jgi:hypothetical protein
MNRWVKPKSYDVNDDFDIEFSFSSFNKMSFNDAARFTAHKIAQDYDNLAIAYSGGIDSEYVLKVFLEQNIAITPIILVSPLVKAEMQHAVHFCQQHSLDYYIIQLTMKEHIIEILKGLYETKGNLIHGYNPIIINRYFPEYKLVTGNGEPSSTASEFREIETKVIKNAKLSELLYHDYDTIEIGDISFHLTPEHPGSFFLYTQELYYAYLTELDSSLSLHEAKSKLYGLPFRPKISGHDVYVHLTNHIPKYGKVREKKFSKHELLNEMEKHVY